MGLKRCRTADLLTTCCTSSEAEAAFKKPVNTEGLAHVSASWREHAAILEGSLHASVWTWKCLKRGWRRDVCARWPTVAALFQRSAARSQAAIGPAISAESLFTGAHFSTRHL